MAENDRDLNFAIASPEVLSSRTILRARRRLNHSGDMNHGQSRSVGSAALPPRNAPDVSAAQSLPAQGVIHDKQFLKELKLLNKEVLKTVRTNLSRNPGCMLSPIFHDYERHLRKLRQKYDHQSRRRSTSQVRDPGAGRSNVAPTPAVCSPPGTENTRAASARTVTFNIPDSSMESDRRTSTAATLDTANPVLRLGLSQDSSHVPDSFKFAHPTLRKRKQCGQRINKSSDTEQKVPLVSGKNTIAAPEVTVPDTVNIPFKPSVSSPVDCGSTKKLWSPAASSPRSLPVSPRAVGSAINTVTGNIAPAQSPVLATGTPRLNLAPVSSSRGKKTTMFAGKRVRTSMPFKICSSDNELETVENDKGDDGGQENRSRAGSPSDSHSKRQSKSAPPVFAGYKIKLSSPFEHDSDSKDSESGSSISGESSSSSDTFKSNSRKSTSKQSLNSKKSKASSKVTESSSQNSSGSSRTSGKSRRSKTSTGTPTSSKKSRLTSKNVSCSSVSVKSTRSQKKTPKELSVPGPKQSNANGNANMTAWASESSTLNVSTGNTQRGDCIAVALATLNVHEQEEQNAFFIRRCKLFHCRSGIWLDRGMGKLYLKSTSKGIHVVIRAESRRGTILASVVLSDGDKVTRRNKHTVALECFRCGDFTSGMDPGKTSGCLHVKMETEEAADELQGYLQPHAQT